MSLFKQDRILIRELRHAYDASASLREYDDFSEEVLAMGREAAEALYRAAIELRHEQADDDPIRAERDEAAAALYEAALGLVRRFEAKVVMDTTDGLGKITDKDTHRRARAVIDRFLPDGRRSDLASRGESLQTDVRALKDGIAGFEGMKRIAAQLDPLLEAHAETLASMRREGEELVAAQRALSAARTEALRLRRAGAAYVEFMALWDRSIAIEPQRIYPLRNRNQASIQEGDLDEAGVAPLPETPPSPEEPMA